MPMNSTMLLSVLTSAFQPSITPPLKPPGETLSALVFSVSSIDSVDSCT